MYFSHHAGVNRVKLCAAVMISREKEVCLKPHTMDWYMTGKHSLNELINGIGFWIDRFGIVVVVLHMMITDTKKRQTERNGLV